MKKQRTAEALQAYENTRRCKENMRSWLNNRGLWNIDGGGRTIHGENGAVYWDDLSKHPKVRFKC